MDCLTLDNIQHIAFLGLTSGLGVALFCLLICVLFKFFKHIINKSI